MSEFEGILKTCIFRVNSTILCVLKSPPRSKEPYEVGTEGRTDQKTTKSLGLFNNETA